MHDLAKSCSSNKPRFVGEKICLNQVVLSLPASKAAIKKNAATEYADGLYPAFSASGQDVWLPDYRYDCNGVVVSAVGARCGKAFKASGKWNVVANTHPLALDEEKIDWDYAWRLLNNEKWWIKSGSGQPFVKVRESLKRNIYLPPLSVQKKFAANLERVEKQIASAKQSLADLDSLVKSRFIEMFEHDRFPTAPIGKIALSKMPNARKAFDTTDSIRYIDISSIDSISCEVTRATEYLLEDAPSRAQQCVSKGDLLVSTVRPNLKNVATITLNDENLVASTGFCVLRCSECPPEYLKTIVRSEKFTHDMCQLTTGANYPAIKNSDILNYEIPLPPKEDMNQFAAFVRQVDKLRFTTNEAIEMLRNIFHALRDYNERKHHSIFKDAIMNFEFVAPFPQFQQLYRHCRDAEDLTLSRPWLSVSSSRQALEFVVATIYRSITNEAPSGSLFDMMNDWRFVDAIGDETLLTSLHTVRKIGNRGAHGQAITAKEACDTLEQLQFVIGEFLLGLQVIDDYPPFESPLSKTSEKPITSASVPHETAQSAASVASADNIKQPTKEDIVQDTDEAVATFGDKLRKTHFCTSKKRNESENRQLYVRASLAEAGWPIATADNIAIPNSASLNMTLSDGSTIDYVLYGRDSRPLAVIDCTNSSMSPIKGRAAAQHAAELLAIKYGYKPIAYYSSGYQIFCIDQLGYPARRVFGFHSLDELELLKQRANSRQDITNPVIDDAITNRQYQKEAITSVCRAFSNNRRRSLIVMATGTGKTRVSISIADVLLKNNWVKNILFLADRTSLVRQAHKNFNKLLPNVTTAIYSGDSDKRDPNARIIFATYQTMVNLVDGDAREFGIGRFDLIIVDEAHRSLFKKFGSLFNYFDALMVGLTATPRCEENKSTYEVFQLPDGEPDYAYELNEAVDDGFLVGFSVLDRTTEAMRGNVSYDDLTDEQKQSIEDELDFAGGEDSPDALSGAELRPSDVLINKGTIDVMLTDLMQTGLKVNAGDKLGKTIIFAENHREAEVIVERFDALYGNRGRDFCKLIDSRVEDALSLIDRLGERDSMPQIAVSVDMLDTGIDVPDVLNLVFFKKMRSKIKFLQMVGRGTRLSPDIFGPSMDKQGFLIFDYYDNFRFFNTRDTWSTTKGNGKASKTRSQNVAIESKKLSILRQLQQNGTSCEFDAQYKNKLHEHFVVGVRNLNNDLIEVNQNLAYVNKYRTDNAWDSINDEQASEIEYHVLPLLPQPPAAAKVKSFDMLIYTIEDQFIRLTSEGKDPRFIKHGFRSAASEVSERAASLLKLKTIPEVMKKESIIAPLLDGEQFIDDFSLEKGEFVRTELRDLMRYIEDKRKYYIVDFPDTLISKDEQSGINKQKNYADKLDSYLNDESNTTLAKIRMLEPLSSDEKAQLSHDLKEKIGTAADYASIAGSMAVLPFVRKQIGISDEAIEIKFGETLHCNQLSDEAREYLLQMIEFARVNGDITAQQLQIESPFCDVDFDELFPDESMLYLKTVLDGLHKPVVE